MGFAGSGGNLRGAYQAYETVREGNVARDELSVRREHNGRIDSGRGPDVETLLA